MVVLKSAKLDAFLACFTHLQHGRLADAQVVELFVLRAALRINCVYCCFGTNEVVYGD